MIALDSPIDYYSDQLFWVHMAQHIILLTVAPPLILLGRPWPRMWQALPLSWRTSVGRTLAGARWTAPIRAIAKPVPAFMLFNANMLLWHIPGAYNLTLTISGSTTRARAVLLHRAAVLGPRGGPGAAAPAHELVLARIYVTGAMIVGWVLAILLVLVKHPLYPHYARAGPPSRRNLGADRPAGGRRDDVGARIGFLLDRAADGRLPLAEPDSARPAPPPSPDQPEEDGGDCR